MGSDIVCNADFAVITGWAIIQRYRRTNLRHLEDRNLGQRLTAVTPSVEIENPSNSSISGSNINLAMDYQCLPFCLLFFSCFARIFVISYK